MAKVAMIANAAAMKRRVRTRVSPGCQTHFASKEAKGAPVPSAFAPPTARTIPDARSSYGGIFATSTAICAGVRLTYPVPPTSWVPRSENPNRRKSFTTVLPRLRLLA